MKFMIEFRLKPGHKDEVLATFERVGPNRNAGVTFRGAWIATRSDTIFVLAEGDDESRVAEVASNWSEHGVATVHAVIAVDQL
jgi:hypothetical protein